MNYIGSKYSLLKFIDDSISQVIDKDSQIFCDIFAGTGVVGLHYKKKGYQIISNDWQYYSYILNKHYIQNHKELEFAGLVNDLSELSNAKLSNRKNIICDYLNDLPAIEGFVYKEFCPNETCTRKYFSSENGKRCDAIRTKIENWKNENKINENEYYFLLTSLLESIDKVANTASVYGAFLKQYKKSALQPLNLQAAKLYINDNEHIVYNHNANDLIQNIEADIVYIDPPYNHRQYATNYHVLESIAKYDTPQLYGKTGLREYNFQKSKYCSKSLVKTEFADLIKNAKSKYIFLSYNNEGLLSFQDIKEILQEKGRYGYFEQTYSRYKADNNRQYSHHLTIEYLHYCIVDNHSKNSTKPIEII